MALSMPSKNFSLGATYNGCVGEGQTSGKAESFQREPAASPHNSIPRENP